MTPALMNYIGGVLETFSLVLNVLNILLWIVIIVLGTGVLIASEDEDAPLYRRLRRLFVIVITLSVATMTVAVLLPDKKTFTALYETYWKVDINTPSSN